MAEIEITIDVKIDGQPLRPGYPITRRIVAAEAQEFDFTRAQAVMYDSLPIAELDKKLLLVIQADKETQLAVNSDFEKPIKLFANGVLVLLNGELSFGGPTFQNTQADDTRIQGIGAG